MHPRFLHPYLFSNWHHRHLCSVLILALHTTPISSQDPDDSSTSFDPDALTPEEKEQLSQGFATSPFDDDNDSSSTTLTSPPSNITPPPSPSTTGSRHKEDGVLNYYFLLLFIFVIIILIAYYNVSRRRKAHQKRLHHRRTDALHQDLSYDNRESRYTYGYQQGQGEQQHYGHQRQESGNSIWTGGRRYGRLRRWGIGGHGSRVQETEGLDERGEAPPPYVKEPERVHLGEVGRGRESEERGVMLGEMGKPPDYMERRS